jgi:hypothetical protein
VIRGVAGFGSERRWSGLNIRMELRIYVMVTLARSLARVLSERVFFLVSGSDAMSSDTLTRGLIFLRALGASGASSCGDLRASELEPAPAFLGFWNSEEALNLCIRSWLLCLGGCRHA